jgi:hypothetical protein
VCKDGNNRVGFDFLVKLNKSSGQAYAIILEFPDPEVEVKQFFKYWTEAITTGPGSLSTHESYFTFPV